MSTALQTLTNKLATTLDIGDGSGLMETLKATAFKGQVSDAQMTALLIVANQYGLNPWTKEIYAFPDKNNGIVPVVGVDGWSRILNNNPHFDGMDYNQSENMIEMPGAKSKAPEWMECRIYRKDRAHPTIVREYLDEVYREPFKKNGYESSGPWQTHPKRFLRHKVTIQCARLAFGFGGIFDEDEAKRITEGEKNITAQADVINGDDSNPEREQLIKDAEAVANCGDVDAVRAHLQGLTKAQRVALGATEMGRLGDLAASVANMADADVIEHEEEVPL